MNENFEKIGTGYIVLSVRDLRRLLRDATKAAHKAGHSGRKVGKHCIVITGDLSKFPGNADIQLSSQGKVTY